MTPKYLLVNAVDPACALLDKHGVKSDDRARVLMMAIAGQESEWGARLQVGGPARSFWQFERAGGVAGVFRACPSQVKAVCAELLVPADVATVYEAMAWHDVLAAAMARLLLWTDPRPLPNVGQVQPGWDYYLRNWRPGMPHPEFWPARYGTAMGLVNGAPTKEAA